MRISVPGLGVQYIDEQPPAGEEPKPAEAPFLSVDDAIRQARARDLVNSVPAGVVEASPPTVGGAPPADLAVAPPAAGAPIPANE